MDIVRGVLNPVPVYWLADQVVGACPPYTFDRTFNRWFLQMGLALKTEHNPLGVTRVQELVNMFEDVCRQASSFPA